MNKKAMMDDMFDFISLVLATFFILLFFNIYFGQTINESRQETISKIGSVDAEENLLAYLNSPVAGIGTMTDLIVLWYSDRDIYEQKLKIESEKILKELGGVNREVVSDFGWNIRIFLMPNNEELLQIITLDIAGDYENKNNFYVLPLKNKEYLKIEMYLECQDILCT